MEKMNVTKTQFAKIQKALMNVNVMLDFSVTDSLVKVKMSVAKMVLCVTQRPTVLITEIVIHVFVVQATKVMVILGWFQNFLKKLDFFMIFNDLKILNTTKVKILMNAQIMDTNAA